VRSDADAKATTFSANVCSSVNTTRACFVASKRDQNSRAFSLSLSLSLELLASLEASIEIRFCSSRKVSSLPADLADPSARARNLIASRSYD